MNKLKQNRLRKRMETFSDKVFLASALSNILKEITEDGPNIDELDKIGLNYILCEQLEYMKIEINGICTKLFGYNQ